MAAGLPVSGVVNVTVNLSPLAAPRSSFGSALILGSTASIDVVERVRQYGDIGSVALDFAGTTPEYQAAALYFGQSPRPSTLYIGRWARTATQDIIHGGALSAADQLLSNFTAVTNGSFQFTMGGTVRSVTGLNFSGAANLNAVAALITAATTAYATVTWDAARARFDIKSNATGASTGLSYGGPAGSGTDISGLLKLTQALGALLAPGIAAESALAGVQAVANANGDWYALTVADTTPALSDQLQIAAFIEASGRSRIYAITTQDANSLVATATSDVGYAMKAANYSRTLVQYSSSSPYAVASLLGRMCTVDFTGENTTITLKFKQEPGVVAETLSSTQAATLATKNINALVNFQNGTAIIQEGEMSSGIFIDERHGLDWAQNAVQVDVYNLLYTSLTKIPQTDAGNTRIVNTIEKTLAQALANGLIAGGQWNADGFGQLKTGQYLNNGFYVYAPPISTQSQADREARRSVSIQVAMKLAGAIHFANVAINVNR